MDLVEQLNRIFYPRAIAIIGASANLGKVGFMCIQSVVEAGFRGRIYPVNPSLSELCGLRVYPSVGAIPEAVDLAISVIPAEQTVSVIEECVAKGVKGAIVISGGFKEVGTQMGVDLQARIKNIADTGGMKIIGPNTIGVVNPRVNLNATFQRSYGSTLAGNVALASQSGGMGSYIVTALTSHNVGISKLIGLGNRCNLDFDDVVTYFAEDEETKVIIIYIEGLEQPKQLIEVARRVVRQKPIIAYKGGRGEAITGATLSHTGALAGKYEFYKSAFTQAGIIPVDNITELVDMAKALALQPPLSGNRVAVLSAQAGPGIIMADKCYELGLRLAQFSSVTEQRLRQLMSPLNSIGNPVDPAWEIFDFDVIRGILEAVLQDEGVDALIMASVGYSMELTKAVIDVHKYYAKPIVACLGSYDGMNDTQQNLLEEINIPTYTLPERAVTGLAGLVRYGRILQAIG